MELLYVWVEEYGNIRKQGFNFSPNYDFEVKEENGEYTLVDNFEEAKKNGEFKFQPKNFFGENISNVTAIVGKNGSGKSTLLECIAKIFNNKELEKNKIKVIDVNDRNIRKIKNFYYKDKSSKNKVYFWGTFELNTNNAIIKEPQTVYFTNQFGKLEFSSGASAEIDISIYKNFMNNMSRDKDISEIKNNRINLLGELNRENKTKIARIKYPEKIIVEKFEFDNLGKRINIEKTFEELFLKSIIATIESNFLHNFYGESFKNFENIDSILNKIETRDKFSYNKSEIYNKYPFEYNNSPKTREKEIKYCNSYYNYLKNVKEFKNKYLDKIKSCSEYSLKKNKEILDIINLYNYTYIGSENEWINFRYEPRLSSGEEHMLSLYGQFHNHLKDKKNKNYIILLDEPEIYMHPEWQRKILNSINMFFTEILPNNEYQIILTSHSPFVASDLPRENVIMLDTDKDGNCVVRDDKKDKNIKTFGANIFDLYTDAFFVESSFGEFAKWKIKEVVRWFEYTEEKNTKKRIYTNENGINKEQLEYILNSIGEPLVKNKLQKMYDEYRESKIIDEDNRKLLADFKNLPLEEQLKIYKKHINGDKK